MKYNLNINNRAFNAIKEKRKRVEIRVTTDGLDYKLVKKDDIIKFTSYDNETLKCRVVKNNWYPTMEELLTIEGCKYTLSSTDDFDEGVKSINSFTGYKEGIKKNGVHAIHIEPIQIFIESLNCISDNIDIDKYLYYVQLVKSNMAYPDWLGDFTKEDIKELLENGSKIWIYYLDSEFVCSMMLIPADKKGLSKLGLNDYDYKSIVDYGPMMVNPKYTGNNLQFQMLQELDKYCKDYYLYAASTIHPDNIYSINNLLKDNFECINQVDLKRGTRNVYLKKL